MQIRCPHCHQSIEWAEDSDLHNITCSSCGAAFNLIPEETLPRDGGARRTIGHFEMVARIGCGAFGEVWKAVDSSLDRVVAIKIPRKGQLDATEADQFLREARSAAKLNHPSIVGVHEVGNDAGQLFIVSDFVEGVTLADWLTARRTSFREAAALCAQIAEALHHAHQNGVIHRDLKPGNIMLDAENVPHIMDFGLAKRATGDITMTMDGKVLGTPAYMSPEQARGKAHDADQRSDIYSLGVILFELLTGELPFRGNAAMLLHQVIQDEPPAPRRLNNKIPRDLETACLKCLEKDPHKRYCTAEHLAQELRRYLAGQPIQARPLGPAARTWRWCNRNPYVATLTTFLAVALLLVAWQWSETEKERRQAKENEYQSMLREMDAIRNARSTGYQVTVQNLVENAKQFELDDTRRQGLREMAVACMGDFVGHEPQCGMETHHSMECFDIQVNEHSSRVAYALRGGDVVVADRKSGKQELITPPVKSEYSWVAFDATGRFLACAYEGSTICIYDALNGCRRKATVRIPVPEKLISALFVSSDGERLLVCDGWMQRLTTVTFRTDGTTDQDVVSLRLPGSPERHQNDPDAPRFGAGYYIVPAAFSRTGRRLVLQDTPSEFVVWDLAEHRVIRRIQTPRRNWFNAYTVSRDETRVTVSYGHGFQVFNIVTGGSELLVNDQWTGAVALSPDNATAAACDTQLMEIAIWSIARSRRMATLRRKEWSDLPGCMAAAFAEDGRTLMSAAPGSSERWDLAVKERVSCLGSVMGVPCLSFSPDGSALVAGCADATLRLWNSTTGALVGEVPGIGSAPESIAYSPDGRLIAAGTHDGDIVLVDAASLRCVLTSKPFPAEYVWNVSFHFDSKTLLATAELGFRAWRIEEVLKDGKPTGAVELKDIPTEGMTAQFTACFSPDGQFVVCEEPRADKTCQVAIWNWTSRERLPGPESRLLGPVRCFAFGSDSRYLWYRSDSSKIEKWRLARDQHEEPRRECEFELTPPDWVRMGPLRDSSRGLDRPSGIIAVSSDGVWLANATGPSVLVWYTPLAHGRPAFALPEDMGTVWSVAWHPKYHLLAVGTSAGSVSIWDMDRIKDNLSELGLPLE